MTDAKFDNDKKIHDPETCENPECQDSACLQMIAEANEVDREKWTGYYNNVI